MARKRPRVRRTLLILLLLGLLLLLLELNRFLPGTWPGGGNWGGFKERPVAARQPLVAPDEKVPGIREQVPDLLRGRQGRMVQVRDHEGKPVSDWRLGFGGRTATPVKALDAGAAPLQERDLAEGIRVRRGNGELRHAAPAEGDGRPMIVVVPEGDLPAPRRPQPIQLALTDPATGEPVIDGQARLRGLALPIQGGRLDVPSPAALEPLPAEFLDLASYATAADPWRSPSPAPRQGPRVDGRQAMPIKLPFQSLAELVVPAGERVTRLHLPGGRVLGVPTDGAPILVPAEKRAGWWAELRQSTPGGGERARLVALDEVEVTAGANGARGRLSLPSTQPSMRTVTVEAGGGAPAVGDELVVRYALTPAPDQESIEILHRMPFAAQRMQIELPVNVKADIVLSRRGMAPQHHALPAGDGDERLQLAPGRGVELPVVVRGPTGRPVPLARVHALLEVGGMTWVWPHPDRAVACDDQGEARIGPLPEGPVQIFASAAGHAHGRSPLLNARAGLPTVELALEAGASLHVVVEDPLGRPVPGVRFESIQADDGGAPLVVPQVGASARQLGPRRWQWSGLPLRPLRLVLSAPGYRRSVVRQIEAGAVTWYLTLIPEEK